MAVVAWTESSEQMRYDMKEPQDSNYPIQPSAIATDKHYWGAFGHSETEVSARLIVRLSQDLVGWFPFTQSQIDKYDSTGRFHFNRLMGSHKSDPWAEVIKEKGGKFYVTHAFVTTCFKVAPA